MDIIVLDTSAVLNAQDLFTSFYGKKITIPEIMDELEKHINKEVFENLLDKIEKRNPSDESKNTVTMKVEEMHDNLSQNDIKLLALAMDLSKKDSVVIYTDDYGIQNIATAFSIEFEPIAEKGISKRISWKYYCPACKRNCESKKIACEFCGSKLKRKAGDVQNI